MGYVCCYIDCLRPRTYSEEDSLVVVDLLIEFFMKWTDPRIQILLHNTE
jgi:hypothetical protein